MATIIRGIRNHTFSWVNSCKKDIGLELGIKFRQQIIRRIKCFLSLYVFKSLYLPPANEVWGKVIFLHQFVILFTGGGACVVAPGGACVVALGGHAWFYSGGHAWFYLGGMCGFIRGVHGFIWGGMRGFFSFFGYNGYGQWAGGTHPTGMHSCLFDVYLF